MTKKEAMDRLIDEAMERYMYKDDEWFETEYKDVEAAVILSVTGNTYMKGRLIDLYEVVSRSKGFQENGKAARKALIEKMEKLDASGFRFIEASKEAYKSLNA